MYDAQTINSMDNVATTIYSPWFSRGGDYGLFTLEVIAMDSTSSSLTLTVQMVDKNSSIPGDGSTVGSSFSRNGSQISGSPRITSDITAGFDELVRYKFTLAHATGSTGAHFATFRMLPPVWYDAVKA